MIAVRIWEGLGNQMFQYAYARALQEHVSEEVFLETDRLYRQYFENEDLITERAYTLDKMRITLRTIDLREEPCWRFLKRDNAVRKKIYQLSCEGKWKYRFVTDESRTNRYNEDLVFGIKNDSYIMGQFFCEKYFCQIKDVLWEEFALKKKPELDPELQYYLNMEKTVSLHIRRGDYVGLKLNLVFNRYYPYAINYFKKQLDKPFFLIFTDDVEWTEKNICLENSYIVSRKGYKDYEEMHLMALCKNNIMANSTFSYWGAWLNRNPEKIVITPNGWMPSIIPQNWIRV